MNRHLLVAICLVLAIIACKKSNTVEPPTATNTTHKPKLAHRDSTVYGTRFITIDDANTMIKSYLYSINSTYNDTDLHSFSVNADSLRAYLSNRSIKNVKLIFGFCRVCEVKPIISSLSFSKKFLMLLTIKRKRRLIL